MTRSSNFGFTNVTPQTKSLTPTALGLVGNYATTAQTARTARLSNKTAPVDLEELISYQSYNINRVESDLNIQYPAPVKGGVCYQITEQAALSTRDSEDTDFRVDEPIWASLQIRHPRSGNISGEIVAQVVMRLLSACLTDNGNWRFDDLMRGAERPVVD